MQIVTIDDDKFQALLDAMRDCKIIGRYTKNGKVQIVCAGKKFLLVSPEINPQKIALKPTQSQHESENLGRRLLKREGERGSQIDLC